MILVGKYFHQKYFIFIENENHFLRYCDSIAFRIGVLFWSNKANNDLLNKNVEVGSGAIEEWASSANPSHSPCALCRYR